METKKKKNPQHSKKSKSFVQNTWNILFLQLHFCGHCAGKCCSAASDPHGISTPCLGSLHGAYLLRDPAEAGSDPWDPHPHPSWHLQVLPAAKHHLLTYSPHLNTQRELQLFAGCRQVKQTLAGFPEQLQRFHSPGISLPPKFGLTASSTSPMPGNGCSTLEAPGWLLTLASPFHVLFPTTTNLQVPDLQCMAGVLSSPSLSLKDGLALLAQQARHYTPVQILLPHSSSRQPEIGFSKPKSEPLRFPPDLHLTPATLAASLEHFCCHQGKASI